MSFVCIQCGNRQDLDQACQACHHDTVHDLARRQTRELMDDVEMRLRDRRADRIRGGSVAIGMLTVIGLWFVPGYWGLRGTLYPGLPLLIDQWALMVVVALAAMKLLERRFDKRRFPYVDELPPLA